MFYLLFLLQFTGSEKNLLLRCRRRYKYSPTAFGSISSLSLKHIRDLLAELPELAWLWP
ncbi:hypothetical protein CLOSTHATH_02837 [Hungatella hathewayi DSM 13479]|uniref:Uncharacterized protein n=1 Tax=Hungatella hathewayi DSM 13479 TaxID=566550 RepID=D3AGU9_9FIRM|nr:hypothetical protein CLOSTHATH_02837 [Hungatella hathewayi DSM 13479]